VTSCAAVAAAPGPAPGGGSDEPDFDLGMSVRLDPSGRDAEIRFALEAPDHVSLAIVDVSGRRLATLIDDDLEGGPHEARWDSATVPAGVYFARVTVGARTVARRIIVLH
jgi:hypothetical protein